MTGLAESIGIKIGETIVKEDGYLWNLNPHPMWDLTRVICRDNRITLSAGDSELDADFWQAVHAADINAAHAEIFARAA